MNRERERSIERKRRIVRDKCEQREGEEDRER